VPSPAGHTLIGLCGFLLTQRYIIRQKQLWLLGGCVLLSLLPDFDVVPGLLLGDPRLFHRQGSHSVTSAALVGLLIGCLARWWRFNGRWWGIWGGSLYLSHIILDTFVDDPSPPFGVQLLWPFSDAYVISSVTPLPRFDYFDPDIGFIQTMLSVHSLVAMIQEITFLSPLLAIAWYWQRRQGLIQ
jgi:inner membrane protein